MMLFFQGVSDIFFFFDNFKYEGLEVFSFVLLFV